MNDKTNLTVIEGGKGAAASAVQVQSPKAPPLIDLNDEEMLVWEYICASLRNAGIEHITAGLPIALIVRTYSDWLAAVKKCGESERYQTSEKGWISETPWAVDERRLKTELSQWLPKACLTIPALTRVKKDMGVQDGQDDLFSDLVERAQSKPRLA